MAKKIDVPFNGTKEQEELLNKFNQTLTARNRPRYNAFAERAKNFLRDDQI